MNLTISRATRDKLKNKHCVEVKEIEQCFLNRQGCFLIDTREDHKTQPPTLWFIAETDLRRLLKVVFICHPDNTIEIKTAYEPSTNTRSFYNRKSTKPSI